MLRLRFLRINKTISPALKRLIVEITYESPASRGDKIKNKLISQKHFVRKNKTNVNHFPVFTFQGFCYIGSSYF